MDRVEKMHRASEANILLNHPLMQEMFKNLEERALSSIRGSIPGDLTAAAACATIKALEDIRGYLNGVVNDEKVADQLESRKKFRPL